MFRLVCTFLAAATVSGALAFAGDLTPPAGPPGATMRTLEEVEPRIPIGPLTTPGDANCIYRITAPGSYYLTADIVGEAFKHGVVIEAPDVTLDLGGFALRGVTDSLAGVFAEGATTKGVRVHNGVVRDWDAGGVDFYSWVGIVPERVHLSDLQVIDNAGNGIAVRFSDSIVERCITIGNSGAGIIANNRALIRDCIARFNDQQGILTTGGVVERCIASANEGVGILAVNSSTVSNSRTEFNTLGGIEVQSSSVVANCASESDSVFGLKLGAGSSAFDSTVYGTIGVNSAGILAIFTNTVARCSVRNGFGRGIEAGENSIVRECIVHNNANTGIYALGGSQIIGNTSNLNAVGILLAGGQLSRVEGNSTHRNVGQGIRVTGDSNLIIRNYSLLNGTNYDIAANNMFGTVIGDFATMNAAPNNSFNVGN